ncbi:30S ribosomal protein S13 [Candidatus Bathyarchaeota archaeon]|nr:MAG: 30S ribosomal protein S13 [Candidatus Bathyarchaeota archaeon]HHL41512.1 30S ribosomal protein S13 [Candidatus Bathyarchaeota archaeon]
MSREFNYIVRLHGTNIDGTKMVPYAITEVKGVGVRLARAIVKQLGLDATERLGSLSDADVKKLETAIDDPVSIGLPIWMLNRQKDPMTGDDLHLLASDLDLRIKDDIDLMRETRSWKGDRHSRGLKVRGQRTKTTGRTGRSVGVSRARVQRQQAQ